MAFNKRDHLQILIQDRSRLFRECCKAAVEAHSEIEVLDLFSDGVALALADTRDQVGAVLFEMDDVPWSVADLVSQFRAKNPNRALVGVKSQDHRSEPMTGVTQISRSSPVELFIQALFGQLETGEAAAKLSTPSAATGKFLLSEREFQVLLLIAGGLTTAQIADRLHLSRKTIESRRESLFLKLGVQNQSHAVAVAASSGLLGSSSIRANR